MEWIMAVPGNNNKKHKKNKKCIEDTVHTTVTFFLMQRLKNKENAAPFSKL